MTVVLLDPSLDSKNLGDQIIREAVLSAMDKIGLDVSRITTVPTQRKLSDNELSCVANASLLLVGGTNLLSSNMPFYRQWKLGRQEIRAMMNKALLLGVGWWQYQGEPNILTKWILGTVLSDAWLHSVRDSWTAHRLRSLGVQAINTTCPTMWMLGESPETRQTRGDEVLFTLTDYARQPRQDTKLVDLLARNYSKLYFWPQGAGDARYLDLLFHASKLRAKHWPITVLNPTVPDLADTLTGGTIDYVGTRLHAGIFALQRGARTTIVAVDNRATEIAKDTGLKVISRRLDRSDTTLLLNPRLAILDLPWDSISKWIAVSRGAVKSLGLATP